MRTNLEDKCTVSEVLSRSLTVMRTTVHSSKIGKHSLTRKTTELGCESLFQLQHSNFPVKLMREYRSVTYFWKYHNSLLPHSRPR